MTLSNIIDIDQITKVYQMGDVKVIALDGISLSVQEGEFLTIMGPSGSGKSTLMNILGCLDRPTSGSYLLAGEDVSRMSREQLAHVRNQKIGFIFQSYNLLPQATAIQNVLLPIVYRRNSHITSKERSDMAHNILASVGLVDRGHHKPTEMSGGQQQRVAIARALINKPALILADEPTGNLDSHSGQEIMEILQMLNKNGHTIVMITHDAKNAGYAGRVLHLKDGKLNGDTDPVVIPSSAVAGGIG
ncbi:MAG TPA: ABC transporter ATP-binding protein [Anaerolineales bacterium]|nr:ABC transporter ATP-binding protein [Anaerolineales bacterium]